MFSSLTHPMCLTVTLSAPTSVSVRTLPSRSILKTIELSDDGPTVLPLAKVALARVNATSPKSARVTSAGVWTIHSAPSRRSAGPSRRGEMAFPVEILSTVRRALVGLVVLMVNLTSSLGWKATSESGMNTGSLGNHRYQP